MSRSPKSLISSTDSTQRSPMPAIPSSSPPTPARPHQLGLVRCIREPTMIPRMLIVVKMMTKKIQSILLFASPARLKGITPGRDHFKSKMYRRLILLSESYPSDELKAKYLLVVRIWWDWPQFYCFFCFYRYIFILEVMCFAQ